jgi:hypothetical protein
MTKVEFDPDKYVVIPRKYLKLLALTHRVHLIGVLERVQKMRGRLTKEPDPAYYVCKQDEPYADKVLEIILQGEKEKLNELER